MKKAMLLALVWASLLIGPCAWANSIAAGQFHSLALTSECRVWAWGYNALGQLDDGTVGNQYLPVPVSGLNNVGNCDD